ncbi:preprotein translocase subunit SecG [Dyella caseinilytica]|uniref:Protein-export membrane protein SecG n=1 Tax=Dyella caseinilytica TaxID=1849581 RepID=A0ABX7GXU4_9GAMM|nr:preprotein translocase subunit SecG [Dyella caseinilytica]QRN55301.1 preprotein translocase subunit SecG [Dyella caseinilytica]GGA00832.1 preprotein translocase subunit SecG [Dyella caseinilytica]
MFVIFSVFYILIAAAMIVLILMQRGAGADAGSGFGAGASSTVFGARGSANFLSRSTAVLAALFFALSLGMGIYLKMNGGAIRQQQVTKDLGVMAGIGNKPVTQQNAQLAAPAQPQAAIPAPAVPAAGNGDVPAAQPAPAKAQQGEVPVATAPAAASTSKH